MTLDELINVALEAKEHCVPGETNVRIIPCSISSDSIEFPGEIYKADYDNGGLNLYYNDYEQI